MKQILCILCGKRSEENSLFGVHQPLCRTCLASVRGKELSSSFKYFCRNCGIPLISGSLCSSCRRAAVADQITFRSCFFYQDIIKELIIDYKFRGMRELSALFAESLLNILISYNYPVVVPVPGKKRNSRKRGWDQIQLITDILMRQSIRVYPLLKSVGRHKDQKKLNKAERSRNAMGGVSLNMNAVDTLNADGLLTDKSCSFILIDDIKTTGSTFRAAAAVLIDLGINHINAISIAMD
jgi:ComF family protein